jgi:hypothetical protein
VRLSLAPLLELTQAASHDDLAVRVGVRLTSIRQAVTRGLSIYQADAWSVACGYHPSAVWPDWYLLEHSDRLARPGTPWNTRGTFEDHQPDLTMVDEAWGAVVIVEAVADRLRRSEAVIEYRQLCGLSAQEMSILIEREAAALDAVRMSHEDATVAA